MHHYDLGQTETMIANIYSLIMKLLIINTKYQTCKFGSTIFIPNH